VSEHSEDPDSTGQRGYEFYPPEVENLCPISNLTLFQKFPYSWVIKIDELVKSLILLDVAHKRLFTKPSKLESEKMFVISNVAAISVLKKTG